MIQRFIIILIAIYHNTYGQITIIWNIEFTCTLTIAVAIDIPALI